MGGSGGSYPPAGSGGTSGQSPGDDQSRGNGDESAKDDCDLSFRARLFGVTDVAEHLRDGDVLDVVLNTSGPTPAVNVMTRNGEPAAAGSLVGQTNLGTLIRCMQAGIAYEATVTEKSGSQITVVVTRV